jgi:hypothetical protein
VNFEQVRWYIFRVFCMLPQLAPEDRLGSLRVQFPDPLRESQRDIEVENELEIHWCFPARETGGYGWGDYFDFE